MLGILKDEQILDPKFRSLILKEINGSENESRKRRELKKYEVYKDRTSKWVIEQLKNEALKPQTIAFMSNRAANISVCRKIIDKLSRSYTAGAERFGQDDAETESINIIAKELQINEKMKKVDRYRNLHHNCVALAVPCKDYYASDKANKDLYRLDVRVIPPFMYDVIPDAYNPEIGRVLILSDYDQRTQGATYGLEPGSDGRSGGIVEMSRGDGVENIIADSVDDKGKDNKQYIWWSENYHFTTNSAGAIIGDASPEGLLNPINRKPWENFAFDQDGAYWSEGGEDVIDGSLLVNVMLTDMNCIMTMQGWGQLVVTGHPDSMPKDYELSPYSAMELQHTEGQPTPTATYLSSNPPIDQWMRSIEQHLAMLLSTNDLSVRSVSGTLDANNVVSGIAKLIDESDVIGDIQEMQVEYAEREKHLWSILKDWYDLYNKSGQLVSKLSEGYEWKSDNVSISFNETKPVISESEKLENLKLRKELGLNTLEELIKLDNPGIEQEALEQKIAKLTEEKLRAAAKEGAEIVEEKLAEKEDRSKADVD